MKEMLLMKYLKLKEIEKNFGEVFYRLVLG